MKNDVFIMENRINHVSSSRLLIYRGQEIIPLDVSEILFAYIDDNKNYYVCTDDDSFNVSDNLEILEKMLGRKYFRINRQYIVSFKIIHKIFLESNSKISIKFKKPYNRALNISRRKIPEFKQWLASVPKL